MPKVLPANRVVALGSFAVALGGVIAAFVGVFPTGTQNTVLAVAALLAHAPTAVTFLLGAQKHEARVAQAVGAASLADLVRQEKPPSA